MKLITLLLLCRFQASKEQLRVLRNFNRFLSGRTGVEALGQSATTKDPVCAEPSSTLIQAEADVCSALQSILVAASLAAFPCVTEADLANSIVTPLPLSRRAVVSDSHASSIAFVVCSTANRSRGFRRTPKSGASSIDKKSGVAEGPQPTVDVGVDSTGIPFGPPGVAAAIVAQATSLYESFISSNATDQVLGGTCVRFSSAPSGHINITVVGGVYRIALRPSESAAASAMTDSKPFFVR